jgi:hypothetical protein
MYSWVVVPLKKGKTFTNINNPTTACTVHAGNLTTLVSLWLSISNFKEVANILPAKKIKNIQFFLSRTFNSILLLNLVFLFRGLPSFSFED